MNSSTAAFKTLSARSAASLPCVSAMAAHVSRTSFSAFSFDSFSWRVRAAARSMLTQIVRAILAFSVPVERKRRKPSGS